MLFLCTVSLCATFVAAASPVFWRSRDDAGGQNIEVRMLKSKLDTFARYCSTALALWACATPARADHEEGFLLVGIFLLSTLIFLAALPFMRAGWLRSFCALLAYFIGAVIAALPVDFIFPSSHASETQQMTLIGLYLSACGWIGAFALLLWWRREDTKRSDSKQ